MSDSNQAPLVGDTDAAVDFLRRFHGDDGWLLTAIEPDGEHRIETKTLSLRTGGADWIARWQGKRNLYFSVNRVSRALTSKAKKSDIAAMVALHVDLDPEHAPEGGDPAAWYEAERARLLAGLRAHAPAPSVIINSGNGVAGYWLLRQPVPVADSAHIEALERYNKGLVIALDGDRATFNIDRIMRLPGTINLPTKTKRAKGMVPALAHVIEAHWDRRYVLDDFAPAPAEADRDQDKPKAGNDADLVDSLPISARMKNLIRGVDDPKHPYDSRSERVFAVLCDMVGAGCADEQITAIFLSAAWSISGHVFDQKKPEQYLTRQIAQARKAASDPAIAELNENYALVLTGGETSVLRKGISTTGKIEFTFMSPAAFRMWHGNKLVWPRGADNPPTPLGEYWLKHRQRRQFEGLVFDPGGTPPNHFNFWRGFAVEPRPGDCSKFLAHVRDNICRGDEKLYGWVIGWAAAIVQHPEKKTGTALAIRGKQGTGKTIFGKIIGSLLGDCYVLVSDPRYITGRFNSHLASCILLHADEGFWAGDKAAEGKLKDLITGGTQLVELKGKEPFRVKNFLRLLVTGNSDWVAPAGLEERRFAVLDIGEAHMQDGAYFADIEHEMDHGGREALMNYLMRFDLNSVNLREVPKTAALLDQKIASMKAEHGWLLDLLQNGKLPLGCDAAGACPASRLYEHYVQRGGKVGTRRGIETALGMFLKKMLPGISKRTTTYKCWKENGEEYAEYGSIYEFPDLDACRKKFMAEIKQEIEWTGPGKWVVWTDADQTDADGPKSGPGGDDHRRPSPRENDQLMDLGDNEARRGTEEEVPF